MKSKILLAIGISVVVVLGGLSAFQNQQTPQTPPQQQVIIAQSLEN